MTFREVVAQVIDWLQQDKRVSYRALKREFDIDDDYIEDVKEALLYAHASTVQADARGFTWASKTEATPVMTSQPDQPEPQPVMEQTQPVQEPPSPVEPHTPNAERRQLTVIFCDLVGSTALSGKLDPEDLREVIRSYQDTCTSVIHRYDGHVAQHLGDGLLVYFGYPQAHEDDPQRAVHTGLEILESLKNLNAHLAVDRDIQLSVRVGIHTGLVVVGEIGRGSRHEQLALGETPNIAARIEGIATPNTVVISADTHRLVEGYFDCQVLGAYRLKGVAQPVTAYRVLQESETQNRLDITASRGLTPLVGRESELSLLLDRWEQARSGQGQVVLLSGEAGIGKSRLTRTLRERVATEPHHRLECHCSPYFQNTTLYPLLDLLERTLGFERQDTPETKLQKLEVALSQYRLDMDATVPLLAFPLSIPLPEERYPPLNMTPQRRKQKALETFMSLLLETAEQEPVLFILEDLHWMDATTIELLDLLIEQVPTASILAVLTCRPDFQPPWGLKSHLTPIALNRLPRLQIAMLVERVAEGKRLPDAVIQHLIEKTDGVPLYIEEMTKALLESGHLTEHDTGYELTEPLATLSIPATLQDSLMARLDHLDSAKGVAQLGATIGRQFPYDLLQAVSPLDETSLQSELAKLVDAELIYPRGVAPNPTYMFKHALVQDSAYQSLLRSSRQAYHRRIAEVLEAEFPETAETQPELLAHHYTQAGLYEPAIGYWQRAGDRASERSAYQEAISHVTTGLSLLQSLPETLTRHQQELPLQIALGAASHMVRGHTAPDVETAYTRARVLCQQLGDSQDVFPVLLGLWRFYVARADYPTARQLGDDLLSVAKQGNERPLYIIAHYALGWTCLNRGEFLSAHRHLAEGITHDTPPLPRSPLFRAGLDPGVGCRAYAALTQWFLGYPDQALSYAHDALLLATEFDHAFSHAFALLYASMVRQFRREGSEAYDHAAVAVPLAREQGFTHPLALNTVLRGWALTACGQPEEGLTQMRQGLMDWRATGAEQFIPYFLTLLAQVYERCGEYEESLGMLSEAFRLVLTTGEKYCEAELYRLKGQLLCRQSSNNTAETESCFQQAITVAQNQSAKSWELRAATSLARLWQQQDKRQDAYDLLAPVYNWFTEGFDTADLKDAKVLLDALAAVCQRPRT